MFASHAQRMHGGARPYTAGVMSDHKVWCALDVVADRTGKTCGAAADVTSSRAAQEPDRRTCATPAIALGGAITRACSSRRFARTPRGFTSTSRVRVRSARSPVAAKRRKTGFAVATIRRVRDALKRHCETFRDRPDSRSECCAHAPIPVLSKQSRLFVRISCRRLSLATFWMLGSEWLEGKPSLSATKRLSVHGVVPSGRPESTRIEIGGSPDQRPIS